MLNHSAAALPHVLSAAFTIAAALAVQSAHAGGGTDGPPRPYHAIDLGTLGGQQAAALDMHIHGAVVGWAENVAGVQAAFLQFPGYPMFQFGAPGAIEAASDLPEDTCGWVRNELGVTRAMWWNFDLIVEIGAPSGEPSMALDISVPAIVGWLEENGVRHAWAWTDEFRLLPSPGGDAEARATNNRGTVAGVAVADAPHSEAVRWVNHQIQYLGTLGAGNSAADGMNHLDQIVGVSDTSNSDPPARHAFLWLPAPDYGLPAGMNDLGLLPGWTETAALSINGRGAITGYASGPSTAPARALLWQPARGMQDLNDLIDNGDEWELLSATAINEAQRIVGFGLHDGVQRAFLLLPALPGDTDADCAVDLTDLTALLCSFGISHFDWDACPMSAADFDRDFDVDLDDLTLLLANFGTGCG